MQPAKRSRALFPKFQSRCHPLIIATKNKSNTARRRAHHIEAQYDVRHIDDTPPVWSARLALESMDRHASFLRIAYTVREKRRTPLLSQADVPLDVGGEGSGHWTRVIAVGTVEWSSTWPALDKQMNASLEDT